MSDQASLINEDELDRRFVDLVEAHQVMVYRYARYLTGDPVLAEEISQDAFITAYRKLATEPPSGDTGAWLRGVARNLVLRARSKRKTRVLLFDDEGLEVAEKVWQQREQPGSHGDPRLDALRACMEGLNAGEMNLVKLRFEEDRSRQEIAEALQLSMEGVKTRLRRLRAKLLECTRRRLGQPEE